MKLSTLGLASMISSPGCISPLYPATRDTGCEFTTLNSFRDNASVLLIDAFLATSLDGESECVKLMTDSDGDIGHMGAEAWTDSINLDVQESGGQVEACGLTTEFLLGDNPAITVQFADLDECRGLYVQDCTEAGWQCEPDGDQLQERLVVTREMLKY